MSSQFEVLGDRTVIATVFDSLAAGGPSSAAKLARLTGIPKDAVRRALYQLKRDGHITKPRNAMYCAPRNARYADLRRKPRRPKQRKGALRTPGMFGGAE